MNLSREETLLFYKLRFALLAYVNRHLQIIPKITTADQIDQQVEGLSDKVGMTVAEMVHAAGEGRLRAMFVMGENPLLSDPDIHHTRECLEKLDFLVVQDIFLTETAELAHVVLPAAAFAEKEGTFTVTDRRIQRVRKVVDPPGEAQADWEILCALAKYLGAGGFDFSSPER